MPKLEIEQFACLSDNYAVLIHDAEAGVTASIDAPDADAILKRLSAKGWRLTHLLITHHHADHTGGNLKLKQMTDCTVIGPRAEAERIPGIDREVGEREGLPVLNPVDAAARFGVTTGISAADRAATIRVAIDTAIAAVARGAMRNGPLIIALQWLALNRGRIAELLRAANPA